MIRFKIEENERKINDYHILDTDHCDVSVINSNDLDLIKNVCQLLNGAYQEGLEDGYENGRRDYDETPYG